MTKSEICRAIAERMEPLESVKWIDRIENDYESYSPLGFWEREYGRISRTYAPDFFQNESANALLLDSMRKDLSDRSYRVLLDLFHHLYDCRETDRKTKVVEAACKWLGIDYGTIED